MGGSLKTLELRAGLGGLSEAGGLGCSTQPLRMRNSRWTAEFQWFLTELSVRPGSSFAISAHLLGRGRRSVFDGRQTIVCWLMSRNACCRGAAAR